jgi:hypothetical protein
MHSHSSFLLPLPQCSLGDINSMTCNCKGPASTIQNWLHFRNLVVVIDLLPPRQRLSVGNIQTLSSFLLSSLPKSSNTLSRHSKLDHNSSDCTTVQLDGRRVRQKSLQDLDCPCLLSHLLWCLQWHLWGLWQGLQPSLSVKNVAKACKSPF